MELVDQLHCEQVYILCVYYVCVCVRVCVEICVCVYVVPGV